MKTMLALAALALATIPAHARELRNSRVCHGETKGGAAFAVIVTDTTKTQKYDAAIKLQIEGRNAILYKAGFAEAESDVSASFASSDNGGLHIEMYDAPEAGQSSLRARAVGGAVNILCDDAQ